MRYAEGTRRLAQYRKRIVALRGKMRRVQPKFRYGGARRAR